MSIYYKLITSEGSIIFANLPPEYEMIFEKCIVQNELITLQSNFQARHGKKNNENGTVYLLTTDTELINRPRYFKEKLSVLLDQLHTVELIKAELKNDLQAANRRLIHNITSANGKNILELYSIVPENRITDDFREIKETIKRYLKDNPDGVADAFLRIAKNSIAMKSEFTVFKKIDGDPSLLQIQAYDIRRVLLLVLHVFYHDFRENDVNVLIDESSKRLKFDFETLRVALHHLLDNTAKYIMPNSQFRIRFSENKIEGTFSILLQMMSMEIKSDEINEIFKDGYSGVWAKKTGKNGDGLGLHIVRKILQLNNAELIVKTNIGNSIMKYDGVAYARNEFEIKFLL